MPSKTNRKMAKNDTGYKQIWLTLLTIFGTCFAFAIALHFYPLPHTTTPSPSQQTGLTVILSRFSVPPGITAYVPIYLSNPSNVTTAPKVFINISESKYSAYLLQNESNLEFYYELPSLPVSNSSLPKGWVEDNSFEILNYTVVKSNATTIATLVNLPYALASYSNMTIYLGFKSD